MKKIKMIVLVIIALFMVTHQAYASHESYQNLIDLRHVYIVNTDVSAMKHPIKLEAGATYTFVIGFDAMANDIIDDNIETGYVLMEYQYLDEQSQYMQAKFDVENKKIYAEFQAEKSLINFLSFPYSYYNEEISLYKGFYQDFKGFYIKQQDSNRYGQKAEVDISDFNGMETLQSLIKFRDPEGQMIDYSIDLGTLDLNQTNTGIYHIIYQTTYDGMEEYVFLEFHLFDAQGPTLTQGDTLKTLYKDREKLSDILKRLDYEDNRDLKSQITLEVIDDQYTSNLGVVGDYLVKIKLTDTDQNATYYDVTISVFTDIGPVISGPIFIGIGTEELQDLESHLRPYFESYSHYEGLPLEMFFTIPQNIENIKQVFDVTISSTDRFGNVGSKTIQVHLYPSQSRLEVVFSQIVIQTTTKNILSEQDIITIIKDELSKQNIEAAFKITHNEYEHNEDQAGHYLLEITYNDEGEEKTLNIAIENKDEDNEDQYFYYIVIGLLTICIVLATIKVYKIIKN